MQKANQKDELDWPLPRPWMTSDEVTAWTPSFAGSYKGPCRGPRHGSLVVMQSVARHSVDMSSIFFTLFPASLFKYTSKRSQIYAHKDWIIQVDNIDRDGSKGKRQRFQQCKNSLECRLCNTFLRNQSSMASRHLLRAVDTQGIHFVARYIWEKTLQRMRTLYYMWLSD